MRRACGAALVLILWLVAVLAALAANFAIAARVETLQARIGDNGGQARQHARAGIDYAAAQLLASGGWGRDGQPRRWHFGGSQIEIRVRDEAGKIDLNQAPPGLLVELFRAVGMDQAQADTLAARIVQRRSQPRGRFLAVSELQGFPEVGTGRYAQLREHLGVHAGGPLPVPGLATAVVRLALAAHAEASGHQPSGGGAGGLAYSIDSTATSAAGGRAHVRGVVRLDMPADPGSAYSILGWEEEDSLR